MDERTFVKGFSDIGFSSNASAISCHPAAPAAAFKNRLRDDHPNCRYRFLRAEVAVQQ